MDGDSKFLVPCNDRTNPSKFYEGALISIALETQLYKSPCQITNMITLSFTLMLLIHLVKFYEFHAKFREHNY
jgi:hypothetical protein